MTGSLEIVSTGPLTTVQDRGRPGWRRSGVGSSGAADRPAAALAGRLVGSEPDAAVLEVTLGGLAFVPDVEVEIAVTGAPVPVTVAGRPASSGAPVRVRAGDGVRLGAPDVGLRSYVAVRGGLDVPPVLGSRATDTLSGLGPAPLAPGDRLPVGDAVAPARPEVDLAPLRPLPGAAEVAVLRAVAGPHLHRFPDATVRLGAGDLLVGADATRVAIRLEGPALVDRGDGDSGSAGLLPGAVQVPPDGHPIVFLADAPATGGYPVVAVLREASVADAAQLRPGARVRIVVA